MLILIRSYCSLFKNHTIIEHMWLFQLMHNKPARLSNALFCKQMLHHGHSAFRAQKKVLLNICILECATLCRNSKSFDFLQALIAFP